MCPQPKHQSSCKDPLHNSEHKHQHIFVYEKLINWTWWKSVLPWATSAQSHRFVNCSFVFTCYFLFAPLFKSCWLIVLSSDNSLTNLIFCSITSQTTCVASIIALNTVTNSTRHWRVWSIRWFNSSGKGSTINYFRKKNQKYSWAYLYIAPFSKVTTSSIW